MQGAFYDGQIFDACRFMSDLTRKAKHAIVLVDNYVDASVLTLQNSNNCWRILRYNRNNAGKRHSGAFSFVLCGAAKLKRIRINIPFYHTRLHCCISMWVEDKLPNPEKVCAHTLPFICTSKPMPVSLILPSKYILSMKHITFSDNIYIQGVFFGVEKGQFCHLSSYKNMEYDNCSG